MSYLFRLGLAVLVLCSIGLGAATAQEDDKGYLTRLLQDSLAGEGRDVQINGFEGALSSRATIREITVADTKGIWLTLTDVAIEWDRGALLGGHVSVQELSAKSIDFARLPAPVENTAPAPEARGFKLPELPVSVVIDELKADKITLGDPILGETIVTKLTSSISLIDGSAKAKVNAKRLDDNTGSFLIDVAYKDADQTLVLKMDLTEGQGGVVARLLGLPDEPSMELILDGTGTLDDFTADVGLSTDGSEKLAGTVNLLADTSATEGAAVGRNFSADISGDIAALFAPQYRPFFGNAIALELTGRKAADGALDLSKLSLHTNAMTLTGAASLNTDYWPEAFNLKGKIQTEDGSPVVLPLSGAETRVSSVDLSLSYDAADSANWQGKFVVQNLSQDAIQIANTTLHANGTLRGDVNTLGTVDAHTEFQASGVAMADPALARAVGTALSASFDLKYAEDQPLRLSNLRANSGGMSLAGQAVIDSLGNGFNTEFTTRLDLSDIGRFSGLAGRELSGRTQVSLGGSLALGGLFDIAVSGSTDDLTIDQPQADKMLAGHTTLAFDASRTTEGTDLNHFELVNDHLSLTGAATIETDETRVEFAAKIIETRQISNQLRGPLVVNGTAQQDTKGWNINTSATGPYGSTAQVDGTVIDGAPDVTFSAHLPDIAPFVPQISGPLDVKGTARQVGKNWQIATDMTGPSGTHAKLSGTMDAQSDLNMTATGSIPLGLADPFLRPRAVQGNAQFDLKIIGQPALTAVSGRITSRGARLADPGLALSLTNIASDISLAGGRADIDVRGSVSSGGTFQVTGPVTLSGAFPGNLSIQLSSVGLVDPKLYKTILNGALSVAGNLTGGALISGVIDVGETMITVPSSGFSSFHSIPKIRHIGASRAVITTQNRAGLNDPETSGSGKGGAVYPLNILINAPSRIFVRGRGVDAEFGGSFRITGDTNDILSSGALDLIRGRLDVLEKRFELDEGTVQMQGDFDPFLRFVATTDTDVGTASVIIEGPASAPVVGFTSSPEAPEEEVLSQIFFGRDLTQLSAFQALQLANAVATLAGRGGQGVVSRLRNGFGLDDLDVTTNDAGATEVRVGKYLSDNIYTDVTVGSDNSAGVSLNLDITKGLTARGQLSSDQNTSLGVFFEKDY